MSIELCEEITWPVKKEMKWHYILKMLVIRWMCDVITGVHIIRIRLLFVLI